jgi:tape measure domain-containing protein
MSKNPNISIGFQASAFQAEIKKMNDALKTTKKEFEVTNLAIQANGNQLDLVANKIAGYGKQAEQQRAITNKAREALEQATRAHADAGSKVEAARQAYDKMAGSENASKEELQKLKKELDNANNTYEHLGKAVQTWNNKLLDSQKAENQLKVAVKQTNDELDRNNKKLIENTKGTQNVVTSAGNLLNIYTLIKGLAIGYAGKTLYDALIGDNAKFEQYITSFEVLLGGIDKADKRMQELTIFAAVTPFELPQVVVAEQRLLAYGVAAKDTAKDLSMLGDISMGNAEKLDRISLAYGQVVTNGRLYGTELRQFAENGVPLLAELAKMYGVTEAEMRKMVEDGEIGANAVNAALESMTSAGGKFFGMMQKQSQTMGGMMSTMKDNFHMFARDVGENSFNYLKGSIGEAMDEINSMSQSGELGDIAADWGRDIARFVEFTAGVIKSLWDMKEALVAAGAGVIAFKATMAISSTVTATTNAIEAYTIAVKAGATETAAFTAVMGINPWVLLGAAIATVIVAIATYGAITSDSANKTDKLVEKTAELTDEYERNVKAADRQASNQLGEVEITKRLAGELDTLSKKVNKTTDDKTRMADIVDQLNIKFPDLGLSINSVTGELNMQIGAINNTIDAYRSLIMVQASRQKAQKAATSLIDLEENKKSLQNEYDSVLAEQGNVYKKDQYGMLPNDYDRAYKTIDINDRLKKVKNAIAANDKAIIEANKQINDSFKLDTEYTNKYGAKTTTKPYKPPPLSGDGDKEKKAAEKKRQEEIVKAFGDLKFARDIDEISEADYYNKLETLRDKYFKKGSSDWQNYTVVLREYQDKIYQDRRANSDQWIDDQKYYGKLSSGEEIAAYERIRAYVTEYYKLGVIDYEEYQKQIRELDKDVFAARKSMIEEALNTEVEAEKSSLDARKAALDQEANDIKDSYDKRIKAINKYYDDIDKKEQQNDRNDQLSDLKKEEEKYINAATAGGKNHLKQIRDEIKNINKDIEKDARETKKQKEIEKAAADRDALEAGRLKKLDALNDDYKRLDAAQKSLLGKISDYAVVSANAIETVTKKIQAMVQALSGIKILNVASQSAGQSAGRTSVVLNDYGDKNFNAKGESVDYTKELYNTFQSAIRFIGGIL